MNSRSFGSLARQVGGNRRSGRVNELAACYPDGDVEERQLGYADLGVTSVYLQGIDNTEVISALRPRQAPVMPASAGLLL
jgi:hypothetical protein